MAQNLNQNKNQSQTQNQDQQPGRRGFGSMEENDQSDISSGGGPSNQNEDRSRVGSQQDLQNQ